ncbi:uncharacterized protein NPIL_603421 [Nephila pilipes]|uniref:Uncharacterized protein n=1 Tax=Nephila pilipes TaxID=299642 RepID=A0A8X6QSW3_NEPPI|nr:uncharacterized protein NPIL_603421 [Nephila pilipes]
MVKRKKEGFINYMKYVLQNSMLTGVPQIASAGNVPKKVLRALVFVFCVVGFIYQSLVFMNIYWQYQTVIDVQVENPKMTEMPSFTFCTNNGIMTSKVCADPQYQDYCNRIAEEEVPFDWCTCLPHFCKDGQVMNITVLNSYMVKTLAFQSYEEYQPYLVPFKKMVKDCYAEFKELGEVNRNCGIEEFKNIRAATVDFDVLYACYTVHSLLDRPDGKPEMVHSDANEIYVFDILSEEYNPRITNVQMQLSIHHAKNILNPYSYGYSLKKGFTNLFRLKKTIKRLLPPPYETNCINYLSLWKARGGKGPTSEKECIEECQKNSSLEILGCITELFKVTSNERFCKYEADDKAVSAASHQCVVKNCRPACYEVSYEVQKDTISIDTASNCFVAGIYGDLGFNDAIRVEIKLDGMQTTTYTYSPKYQNIETFSYVGGYIGMWLGISLVAVFDFLETLVIMMRYPFRRIMAHRAKQEQVDRVRKIQRNI